MIFQIYKILRIFFFILFISISFYSLKFYEGSVYIYLIYCLSFISMLYYLTDNGASYFEIFFGSYLFLGFWFKYVFSLVLLDGVVFDSGQLKKTNIDEVLIIGILIALVCILSSFLNRKIINYKKKDQFQKKQNSIFKNFYLNNRVLVILSFSILFISVSFLNINLGIYQRGFINLSEINFFIKGFVKWLLLFGLTSFSCFLIHVEISNLKRINFVTIIIPLLEIFLSYSSMLSRSFVINATSLILPTYQKSLDLKKNYNNLFYIFFAIIIFLTGISVYSVNYLRLEKLATVKYEWKDTVSNKSLVANSEYSNRIENYNFEIPLKDLTSTPSKELTKEEIKIKRKNEPHKVYSGDLFKFILINRWIGIESLIQVHYSGKANFNLLFSALKENKTIVNNTFYERTFGLSWAKLNVRTKSEALKGNTLPGIISFLYYSGNLYFLLISLLLIFSIFNLFEKLIKKLTNMNLIYTCFISNMIATRLMHFGYAPKDSYLFIISILLSVIFVVFLSRSKLELFNKK